jgi:Spa2 homology domain (SHD) of GIT
VTLYRPFDTPIDSVRIEHDDSTVTSNERLTRMTISQFQQLTTDVCDELVRRKNIKASTSNECGYISDCLEGLDTHVSLWII